MIQLCKEKTRCLCGRVAIVNCSAVKENAAVYAQHWLAINCSHWSNPYDFRTAMEIWSVFRNLSLLLSPEIYPCRATPTTHRWQVLKTWWGSIVYGCFCRYITSSLNLPSPQCAYVHIYVCVHMHVCGKSKPLTRNTLICSYLWNREFASGI